MSDRDVIVTSWISHRTSPPLREDLATAASAGDENTRRTAAVLAAALEPAARLAIMNALSDLAAEVTASLDDHVVDVRLDGRDVQVVVTGTGPAHEPPRDERAAAAGRGRRHEPHDAAAVRAAQEQGRAGRGGTGRLAEHLRAAGRSGRAAREAASAARTGAGTAGRSGRRSTRAGAARRPACTVGTRGERDDRGSRGRGPAAELRRGGAGRARRGAPGRGVSMCGSWTSPACTSRCGTTRPARARSRWACRT